MLLEILYLAYCGLNNWVKPPLLSAYLEDSNLLNIDNELHLFCLHYIFPPGLFVRVHPLWKNHPLGSGHNMSPTQLWMTGNHPSDM